MSCNSKDRFLTTKRRPFSVLCSNLLSYLGIKFVFVRELFCGCFALLTRIKKTLLQKLWKERTRTFECRSQSPMPYHLATSQATLKKISLKHLKDWPKQIFPFTTVQLLRKQKFLTAGSILYF